MNELAEKVATVHSEAVRQYVEKMTCSREQKLKILEAIQNK